MTSARSTAPEGPRWGMFSRGWWRRDIPCESMLLPLYFISFITGLLDPGTYAAFNTYASNHTGNVILLTLAASSETSIQLANTGASLASYLLTGFVSGQLGHLLGPRRRHWLVCSSVVQTIFLALPLALISTGVLEPTREGTQWILLTLLAASSGFQVALARTSGCGEVPTAMLSSPMIDLITDPRLFQLAWHKPELNSRNRRLVYIVSLVSGSFVGAFVDRTVGLECVLGIALGLKVGVVGWFAGMEVLVRCEGAERLGESSRKAVEEEV